MPVVGAVILVELLFADSGLVPSIANALGLPLVDWLGGPAAFGVVLVRRLSQKQEKVMDHIMESSRDFSQWFGDNLEGVEEIKLWNLFESRDRAFQDKLDGLLKCQKGSAMLDAWNTLWESLLEWSVTILLYLAGGLLICQGRRTIGAVFTFVSYSWYVAGPVSALLNLKMYFACIMPPARHGRAPSLRHTSIRNPQKLQPNFFPAPKHDHPTFPH